jgi:sigma-B regulation protein RsbU (phosphoserine phosphatase)
MAFDDQGAARDAQGRIIGIIGIGRDITARKNAEEKLARYTEELREKNAEMEDDLDMAREVQQAFLPQQFPSSRKERRRRKARCGLSANICPRRRSAETSFTWRRSPTPWRPSSFAT